MLSSGALTFVMAAFLLSLASRSPAQVPLSVDYVNLVRRYAQGERAFAIEAVGGWKERDLERQFAIANASVQMALRCPLCPSPVALPLRAAVMLHWDRDRAERPISTEAEQPRPCPRRQAALAVRFASLLALRPETSDFARRFYLAAAMSCQADACFDQAERWGNEGLQLFPRDAELLLTIGSTLEEKATLSVRIGTSSAAGLIAEKQVAAAQKETLEKARQVFDEAVSSDPDLVLARIKLGRVLWRLGETDLARGTLEESLVRARAPDERFLAHLFLGRVDEEAGRLDRALACYRLAADIHPNAQSAAVALSYALQLEGNAEESRLALVRGVTEARRQSVRDPYRDYLVGNLLHLEEQLAALYRESLE